MITLSYAPPGAPVEVIALGERLLWADEYDWDEVQMQSAHSTSGALLLDCAQRLAGRPITLDGRASNAWLARTVCDRLRAWQAMPGAVFSLTLRGVVRAVAWESFSAQPLWRLSDGEHTGDVWYLPSFKFIEV